MKRLVTEQSEPPVPPSSINPIEDNHEPIHIGQPHDVPPSYLHGHSLKKLKSYKDIRSKYKMQNMKQMFVKDLQFVLNEFNPTDHQLDDDLLLEVMNLAETFFFYPRDKEDRDRIKLEVIESLMLKYFRDDIVLLHKTIGHISHKVKKSKMINRVWKRLKFYVLKKI